MFFFLFLHYLLTFFLSITIFGYIYGLEIRQQRLRPPVRREIFAFLIQDGDCSFLEGFRHARSYHHTPSLSRSACQLSGVPICSVGATPCTILDVEATCNASEKRFYLLGRISIILLFISFFLWVRKFNFFTILTPLILLILVKIMTLHLRSTYPSDCSVRIGKRQVGVNFNLSHFVCMAN